ncbi:hypothetical protein [Streptomonospora salina]|uniref:Uncharacterized protein n=1 Tax=Streptomonospora salina TaxID=104205 RepID=A0A841E7L1_9ACTN|nr:hypothetical protein [Streptomonospora salina]MBB5997289.1 hypothetical protein [Streptomonospora salina]
MKLRRGGPDGTAPRRPRAGAQNAPPGRRPARFGPHEPAPGAAGPDAGHRSDDRGGGSPAPGRSEADTAAQILLRGLVDDAGLCPPGPLAAGRPAVPRQAARGAEHAPLRIVQAVERHRSDSIVGHPMLSHRMLCPVGRWGDLLRRLDGDGPVEVGLVLDTPEGVGGVVPPDDPDVQVDRYETRARPDDLRLVASLFRSGDLGTAGRVVYFEPVREPGWLDAVDVLSGARPLGAKIRCGGPRPELVPAPREAGAFITACVERDVPFVAAGGPPGAAGCLDPATGAAQYGYLNLLLATAAVVDGDYESVSDLLTGTDPRWLARLAHRLDPATALRTRDLMRGYATRDTGDPVREAAALGLSGAWDV